MSLTRGINIKNLSKEYLKSIDKNDLINIEELSNNNFSLYPMGPFLSKIQFQVDKNLKLHGMINIKFNKKENNENINLVAFLSYDIIRYIEINEKDGIPNECYAYDMNEELIYGPQPDDVIYYNFHYKSKYNLDEDSGYWDNEGYWIPNPIIIGVPLRIKGYDDFVCLIQKMDIDNAYKKIENLNNELQNKSDYCNSKKKYLDKMKNQMKNIEQRNLILNDSDDSNDSDDNED